MEVITSIWMIASIAATDPVLQRYSNIPSSSTANNTVAKKRGGGKREGHPTQIHHHQGTYLTFLRHKLSFDTKQRQK
jgi:hypothetical protein